MLSNEEMDLNDTWVCILLDELNGINQITCVDDVLCFLLLHKKYPVDYFLIYKIYKRPLIFYYSAE